MHDSSPFLAGGVTILRTGGRNKLPALARKWLLAEYVFANEAPETRHRFAALETLYDPVSIRHLEQCVGPGSACLEVGGGSGSIARWMSKKAGEHGRVVVTDIDTRFLDAIAAPNIEVRKHDIVNDSLELASFDVVHTRLVLLHLAGRQRAIERMLAALKPGGWIVLQEFDALSMPADPVRFAPEHLLKTFTAMQQVMLERGADTTFGRKLTPLLRAAGVADIEAEGQLSMVVGGSATARLLRANFDQMRGAILGTGVTPEEFAQDLERRDDPEVSWPSQILWTVRGRRR